MLTGKPADALPLYESSLQWRERMLGPEHPDTLLTAQNLARARLALDQPEQALATAERIYGIQRAALASGDTDLLSSMRLIADIHEYSGNGEEEIQWRQQLLEELAEDSEEFTTAENVESNIRLLELATVSGGSVDIADLRAVIESQLRQGGDALESAGMQYRELLSEAR
jgi:hypothetical protein